MPEGSANEGRPEAGAGQGERRWLLLRYRPTTLFSLRMSLTTSAGGKSLFVPTPYAFKLALIDAAVRVRNLDFAREVFGWIKGREVRFRPPERMVVNHTFIKVKREPKQRTPTNPYTSTINFREFCFFQGEMTVGLEVGGLTDEVIEYLCIVALHINYLGKRGSFMQFVGSERVEALGEGFTIPVDHGRWDPGVLGVTQHLDELGEVHARDLFDRINTYSDKPVSLNKHRVLIHTIIPYRLVRASKGYTEYIRDDVFRALPGYKL